jgi:hypothetical protein
VILAELGERHDVVSAATVAFDRLSPVPRHQEVPA